MTVNTTLVIRFTAAHRDPDSATGYDSEACRRLVHSTLHRPDGMQRVILDVAAWIGPAHPFIIRDLAELLPVDARVSVHGYDPDACRSWAKELSTARHRLQGSPRRNTVLPGRGTW